MDASIPKAFVRFLQSESISPKLRSTLYTASLFVDPGEEYQDSLPGHRHLEWVDPELLEAVLAQGNPSEVASMLWDLPCVCLPPATFSKWFNFVWTATTELRALHCIAGAANRYLRQRPDSIEVPPQLAPLLIESSDYDARIVGHQLLRATCRDCLVIDRYLTLLRDTTDDSERAVVLVTLSDILIAEFTSPGKYAHLESFLQWTPVVAAWSQTGSDSIVRDMAQRTAEYLVELRSKLRPDGTTEAAQVEDQISRPSRWPGGWR